MLNGEVMVVVIFVEGKIFTIFYSASEFHLFDTRVQTLQITFRRPL